LKVSLLLHAKEPPSGYCRKTYHEVKDQQLFRTLQQYLETFHSAFLTSLAILWMSLVIEENTNGVPQILPCASWLMYAKCVRTICHRQIRKSNGGFILFSLFFLFFNFGFNRRLSRLGLCIRNVRLWWLPLIHNRSVRSRAIEKTRVFNDIDGRSLIL
jgi:hypothetical protein